MSMSSVASIRSLPLEFCAPQDVLFAIHNDWKVLVFTLLDGVRAGCDGAHLAKLEKQSDPVF